MLHQKIMEIYFILDRIPAINYVGFKFNLQNVDKKLKDNCSAISSSLFKLQQKSKYFFQ
jgi:hypothetical protein